MDLGLRISDCGLAGAVVALGAGLVFGQPDAPKPPAPTPAATTPAPTSTPTPTPTVGDAKGAEELLTKLETADKDLKSLEAAVLYDRLFELNGDREVRTGKLVYVDTKERGPDGAPAPGSRKFGISFDHIKLGNAPSRPEDKVIVFDGQWLIEKMPGAKQMIKRQVVEEGKGFDPLKIGEGPFPVPIGQKKDDILKRFNAVLLPADDGLVGNEPGDTPKLKDFVAKRKAVQLKLTPKPGPEAQFQEVRLWYAPDDSGMLLPVMARTVNQQGDISIVELVQAKVNQPVPPEIMDTKAPEGWTVNVEKLGGEIRR